MAEKTIKIKLVKSASGHKPNQKATLKALQTLIRQHIYREVNAYPYIIFCHL